MERRGQIQFCMKTSKILPLNLWTFVKEKFEVPPRKIVVGNPAKIVKDVTDEMAAWKIEGTGLYQKLPKECHQSLKEVEPLRSKPKFEVPQTKNYFTRSEIKNKTNQKS